MFSSRSFCRHEAFSGKSAVVHVEQGPFSVVTDIAGGRAMLVVHRNNPDCGRVLWTRDFDEAADCEAVIERFGTGDLDLVFYARVTMIFSPATIDAAVDQTVAEAGTQRLERAEAEAQRRRDAKIIDLRTSKTKSGYQLGLQRKSVRDPEWTVVFERASERDRLCDWMKWQKPRFAAFLEYACEHGSEALSRMLIDEMFATERRVKNEGRSAGGSRPLRMWRSNP